MQFPLEEVRAEFLAIRTDLSLLAGRWTAMMEKLERALEFEKGAAEIITKAPVRGAMVEPARYLCPFCETPMRLRNGSRGEFYGCSNYPECEGTRNINGSNSSRPGCKRIAPRTAHGAKPPTPKEPVPDYEHTLDLPPVDDDKDCPL